MNELREFLKDKEAIEGLGVLFGLFLLGVTVLMMFIAAWRER